MSKSCHCCRTLPIDSFKCYVCGFDNSRMAVDDSYKYQYDFSITIAYQSYREKSFVVSVESEIINNDLLIPYFSGCDLLGAYVNSQVRPFSDGIYKVYGYTHSKTKEIDNIDDVRFEFYKVSSFNKYSLDTEDTLSCSVVFALDCDGYVRIVESETENTTLVDIFEDSLSVAPDGWLHISNFKTLSELNLNSGVHYGRFIYQKGVYDIKDLVKITLHECS